MIKHIVLMKVKSDTSAAQMSDLMGELAGLKNRIDGIVDFSGGDDVSGGERSQGFTHGFAMNFVDHDALKAYLPNPIHKAVGAKVRALNESVLVFDYEC